jgi:methyl-accepting chemotaxis protein
MLTKFVLAGFVACASIFATVIKVMASRGLVRRVAELTTAICQGTEGNLTVQVAVASDDELGHLGKTVNSLFNKFGKMVLQINDTISELGKISDQPRFSISVYVWLNRQDRRSRGICPQSCKPCSFPPGH